ncbi:hypothetical protein [Bradyrhizobium sp. McL0615]|uniref:hypothetical protein n=1 Tax=Bradyrhizobium sp. McL0615 TaxID=3415673 RepID=UPI003CE8994C
MPHWIQAKKALFQSWSKQPTTPWGKLAELTEVGYSEVIARDIMSSATVGLTSLQAETDDPPQWESHPPAFGY